MKHKKINAVQVCKELEDDLAPRLKLSILDRAVYSHLLRHSRFEGKSRLRFSILWLANNMGVRGRSVRTAVRRLIHKGALRLIERSNLGHLVEVRLPSEVRTPRANPTGAAAQAKPLVDLDTLDFMRTRDLRQAIHAREAGVCFYCLRQIPSRAHCLDHVVPQAAGGSNSYRNLASCCLDCNPQKSNRPAEDFLRELYREGRLSAKDLTARLLAVQTIAAGKLRPQVLSEKDAGIFVGAKVCGGSVSG
jgi:5-methylcytosine-specific restriction endonuclease McrA